MAVVIAARERKGQAARAREGVILRPCFLGPKDLNVGPAPRAPLVLACLALLASTLAPGAYGHEAPQQSPAASAQAQKPQPPRYEIDVRFEPERGFLHAQAKVTLTGARCPGAVEFELNPHLKILEVADAEGHKLEFDRGRLAGSYKLVVRLSEPCAAGAKTTLAFTYEGVLPHGTLDYITKDGILLRDESRWYPAIDLAAFTLNDFTIQLPGNWLAVSSGQSPAAVGPGTYHWVTDKPLSSRSIAAVPGIKSCGPFLGGAATLMSPPLQFNVSTCFRPPYNVNTYPNAVPASQILQFYTNLNGRNVGGVTLVQGFPGQRGVLGYSAPGFLVVSEDVVKNAADPNFAPEFLPHEIAHQWFPIEVTLKSEDDGWLAESLAEYLAWRYLQEKAPTQARRMVERAMRNAFAPQPLRPLSRGLRLFGEEDWDVMHATLYDRGMLVWRTLETVIDRERVDRSLQQYYRRYAGKSASIADFRNICEEISGRNLGWFFDYYINGTELPEIELRRLPSSVPTEMAGEIIVKNVPPEFEVRVEMRIDTARGPIFHSVATRGEVTPFTVMVMQPVTRVVLDPDQRILRAAPQNSSRSSTE